jgi:hypothetical protein
VSATRCTAGISSSSFTRFWKTDITRSCEVDTTSEKYFNEGIAGITIRELSERYDRFPAMASR